ncbi:MAG: hypothetical protein D6723_12340 [Acidobacteria bacterium]|nr:MAG: hypothetical protein D6723_12340 [Acidobacteriota bacterium]
MMIVLVTMFIVTMIGAPYESPSAAPGKAPTDRSVTKSLRNIPLLAALSEGIACGETKSGLIEESDELLPDGTPFDRYRFLIDQPEQPYIVSLQADFSVAVNIFLIDPEQSEPVFVQAGFADPLSTEIPAEIQLSGTLSVPGDYRIVVFPDPPEGRGSYQLGFQCQRCESSEGDGGNPDSILSQRRRVLVCGEMREGRISSFDPRLPDNTPFDQYTLTVEQGGQPYIITVEANFNVASVLLFSDPQRGNIFVQSAVADVPDPDVPARIQYSGILRIPGRYRLNVLPATPQGRGSYTLEFKCQQCGDASSPDGGDSSALDR